MAGSGTPNLTLDGSANQAIEDFNANGGTVVFDGTATQSVEQRMCKVLPQPDHRREEHLGAGHPTSLSPASFLNLGTLGAHGHKIIK